MDLYDNPRFPDIVATFELPGVKLSDLSITVKEGVLEIVGQRQRSYRSDLRRLHPSLHATDATSVSESDVDIRHWRCRELRYGVFRRSLQLPTGIEQSAISATMMEGLLTVSWPRAATPSQAPADVGGSDSESHDEIESEFEPESESESESK
ncbi:HSP20-like chaperone [Mycena filopes]|nr:HSP20-like chaperone [Mycena filopes]